MSAPSDSPYGPTMTRRRVLITVSAMLTALALSGAPAGAAAPPSVHGAGLVTLSDAFGDFAGDPVVFQVSARGAGAGATGHFNVVHVDDAGGLYAHATGDVTCLVVDGTVAAVTGIIRHAWFRDFPGEAVVGAAVAITMADHGSDDALGFDFEFFGSTISPCGPIPPFLPLEQGNFLVR
jgi:hypothetical protein